ncbi:MAG: HEAT repeat domain-containing protein [Dehalococcoidales bacterium]|nr:HEAT repeat domain-containing protein [Dehalococcoidales bacterium]
MASSLAPILAAAEEAGFAALATMPCVPFSDWLGVVRTREGYTDFLSLPSLADARETLPEARTIVVAVWDYLGHAPAVVGPGRVARLYLSESDPSDPETHPAARRMAETFARLGWRTSTKAPRREAAVAAGLLEQRRNCLGYLPGGHSFVALFTWVVDQTLAHERVTFGDISGATIETVREFAYPPGRRDPCGRCQACLEACPTQALVRPFVLDPRRCIDRNTWRVGQWLPRELRPKMGTWLYGCDVCQEVCPHNQKALKAAASKARGKAEFALDRLAAIDDRQYRDVWQRFFVFNEDPADLRRNVMVAIGNLGDTSLLPSLLAGSKDGAPVVRGHAAWALGRFKASRARKALKSALAGETDAAVRAEILAALEEQG